MTTANMEGTTSSLTADDLIACHERLVAEFGTRRYPIAIGACSQYIDAIRRAWNKENAGKPETIFDRTGPDCIGGIQFIHDNRLRGTQVRMIYTQAGLDAYLRQLGEKQ